MAAAQSGPVMRAASRVKVLEGAGFQPKEPESRPLLSAPKLQDGEDREGSRAGNALHKAGHSLVTRAADMLSDIVSSIPAAWRSAEQSERSPAPSPSHPSTSLRQAFARPLSPGEKKRGKKRAHGFHL